jgi:hypothetical protein
MLPARRWLMRSAAILLGLSVFIVAETICWLFNVGTPDLQDDPFVGFNNLQPLFVLDNAKHAYHVAPARLKFFVQESFPAQKRPGTYRIFCLGGSTVQGRPFAKETSFTTWLQLALACADPHDPMNAMSDADQLQRCERYVAVTRARERVLVVLA